MKLSSFEQLEDVKNNYQLRNRGPNVNKRGKKAKHLNKQVKANQNECPSAKVGESPVQCQEPKTIDNRSVKERLGVLVRNSIGKKHSRKKSSLEEKDVSDILSQNYRPSLSTSLASETLVQSEECVLPFICNALHVTKKGEKSFINNDSLQNVCQIKEKEECDDNKFDITATCLNELSLQFDEHEVNSSAMDIHDTLVAADNVKEDVELAKKRMGQYVRQRLGLLVESRSRLCSKSTDKALTLKVPNPECETSDNNCKVLKRHHRNRRKVVKSVELEIPISENVNVRNSQKTCNNPPFKKSEMFSSYGNSNAVNTCTEDVNSFEKTTLLDSKSPIKVTSEGAVSPIVNSATFVNSSTTSSTSSLENELQTGSILILEEKDPKERSNMPDPQYSQSVEALLNLYSIQRCYVKLQKCNLNEWKKVNTFKCEDEINSFKSARKKMSLNVHDENVLSTTDGQRSSEDVNENELIKIKKNVDSCSFQSVLRANTAPELARSLFDHSKKLHCSESNMKCVVPNSPKSHDKSIRKTGDLGSLKAVVQAESPRVADTLDTLPDNPAQAIRHYALGGGTFVDPSENQSVRLVGDYLRDSNIVEVAKIPTICYAEKGSDKTSEENDLPNIINSSTKENIIINKDVDPFKSSDFEFLTFTRGCPRKRSLMSDENYLKKREKINEVNPSNIASVTPNYVNSPILGSQEVNFEGKGVEYVSENTGKEEFEENSKHEFLNNEKQWTSNNVKSQCLNKECAEKDYTIISSGIQRPDMTEEMSSFFLSKDHVTCLDKPQTEFIKQKLLQVTNNELVHQKMLCKKRRLSVVPNNASKAKSHSVLRLHKKLSAANKYQAIKSVPLKRSRRLATLKKSLSVTQAENKWLSPTCANHDTKWNSFLWSKRISSSHKNIYHNLYEDFKSKPNAVGKKLTDKIQ
ncbi:Protein of unknown function [Gryllus bimaculatus]|nr:Protein of unknown function [Gryllus bimaculatus]